MSEFYDGSLQCNTRYYHAQCRKRATSKPLQHQNDPALSPCEWFSVVDADSAINVTRRKEITTGVRTAELGPVLETLHTLCGARRPESRMLQWAEASKTEARYTCLACVKFRLVAAYLARENCLYSRRQMTDCLYSSHVAQNDGRGFHSVSESLPNPGIIAKAPQHGRLFYMAPLLPRYLAPRSPRVLEAPTTLPNRSARTKALTTPFVSRKRCLPSVLACVWSRPLCCHALRQPLSSRLLRLGRAQ